jgi:DNA-binding SARP family transcriptional activator
MTTASPQVGDRTEPGSTPRAHRLELWVLGPLEARVDGSAVGLGGRKQRTALALLAANAGKVVATDDLIDGVWGEEPTAAARSTLHTYISNLRQALGDVIVRDAGGYRLEVEPQQVDAIAFEQAVSLARDVADTDLAQAAQTLRRALALWRGHPYADLVGSLPLDVEARRLEELRLEAVEARVDTELALGRHMELAGELEVLCEENPVRERLRMQHMLALYRSGRQAEALRGYQRTRAYLADELGLDPSPQLQELERLILNQDRSRSCSPTSRSRRCCGSCRRRRCARRWLSTTGSSWARSRPKAGTWSSGSATASTSPSPMPAPQCPPRRRSRRRSRRPTGARRVRCACGWRSTPARWRRAAATTSARC